MKRYAVPLVLVAWAIALVIGCTWVVPWVLLLLGAVGVQMLELGRVYRDHHRRWL